MATHYFDSHRGGIEIVAARLSRELVRRGVSLTWLATDATPPPPATAGCGTAMPVPAWNFAERRLGFPLPLPGFSAAATIWREVKAADVVLLHDSLYPTNVLAALTARRHGKPVVIIQHIGMVPYSNPVLRGLMMLANAVITRPMLASASQVVFISETVERHFSRLRYSSPPRLIFNGVDTAVFHPSASPAERDTLRSKSGLPLGKPVAMFAGRFVEKKGLHLIERIARQRPDVIFALAGWGPIEPNSWGLSNVLVFNGLAGPSLADLYRSSDVFLLPSTGEGLPLVMQEALACGLPVICGAETATADPGAAALLDGIAIDTANHDSTADAFVRALDQRLKSAGSEPTPAQRLAYVEQRYSWSRAADAYVELLRSLSSGASTVLPNPPSIAAKERTP